VTGKVQEDVRPYPDYTVLSDILEVQEQWAEALHRQGKPFSRAIGENVVRPFQKKYHLTVDEARLIARGSESLSGILSTLRDARERYGMQAQGTMDQRILKVLLRVMGGHFPARRGDGPPVYDEDHLPDMSAEDFLEKIFRPAMREAPGVYAMDGNTCALLDLAGELADWRSEDLGWFRDYFSSTIREVTDLGRLKKTCGSAEEAVTDYYCAYGTFARIITVCMDHLQDMQDVMDTLSRSESRLMSGIAGSVRDTGAFMDLDPFQFTDLVYNFPMGSDVRARLYVFRDQLEEAMEDFKEREGAIRSRSLQGRKAAVDKAYTEQQADTEWYDGGIER
jgi:hypothetical protein